MSQYQYITQNNLEITAVILPIGDYNAIQQKLIKDLTLASIEIGYDLLNVPIQAREFVNTLIRLRGSDWDSESALTDPELESAAKQSNSTVKRNRRALRKWSESGNGKAILEYRGERNQNQQNVGTVYRLNIVQFIHEAIQDYAKSKDIDLIELCRISKGFETFDLNKRNSYGKPIKELVDYIEKHLKKLPNEPKFEDTPSNQGLRDYHSGK